MKRSISEDELEKHRNFSFNDVKAILKTKGCVPVLRYAVENVDSIGNHSLMLLKMFEVKQDADAIKYGLGFLKRNAKRNGDAFCWSFSNSVTDIPPDADDTGIALLVFLLAKKIGLNVPEKYTRKENFRQFDSLITENGIYTYFGIKKNNDVDPIANTIVAFLLEFSNFKTDARIAIKKYLNTYFEKREKFHSEYYKDKEYFLLRCAKLNFVFPTYFSSKAKKELKKQTLLCKPKTRMQKVFIENARLIIGNSKSRICLKNENFIFPETLFFQRTPFYEYGSQIENQLFEAEFKELSKRKPKHYLLTLAK